MKAVILSINPRAQIIDICHNVNPQDILEAGLLLKSSFKYFPRNTVHLVVVDPGVGSKRRPILVRTKDYYFDNLRPLNWDKVFELLVIYKNNRMEKKVKELFERFNETK